MPIVAMEYIEEDDRGVARIAGTRAKVRMIAIEANAGWTPEYIREQHPHLSLAQIHAALAYYYDHKAGIDVEIEAADRYADEMRAKNPNRFTRAELEAKWREKFGTEPPGVEDAGN